MRSTETGPTQDHQKYAIPSESPHLEARSGPRYGILGGTFDPPHVGHLVVAQEVFTRLQLDRVWFMPAGTPPHKAGKDISPADDRRAMVERAIAGDERFALCDIELQRAGPSYTADTMEQLRATWGTGVTVCFILGWDMLAYLPQWHEPGRVLSAIDILAAVHRPGFVVEPGEIERLQARVPELARKLVILPCPALEVAATELRERVASGLPIRYLVPDAVRHYIEDKRLYFPPAERSDPGIRPARQDTSHLDSTVSG